MSKKQLPQVHVGELKEIGLDIVTSYNPNTNRIMVKLIQGSKQIMMSLNNNDFDGFSLEKYDDELAIKKTYNISTSLIVDYEGEVLNAMKGGER